MQGHLPIRGIATIVFGVKRSQSALKEIQIIYMKIIFGKLILAAPLLALATHASADLPSRTGLVALGCEPNVKVRALPSTHPAFRVSPRKRYIFMNRNESGQVIKLCLDEIDTDVSEPTTCDSSVRSGSIKVGASYAFGFKSLQVFRQDASMVIAQYDGQTQRYSCTPSKDPVSILDYVINQKRTQRSQNAF